MWKQVAITLLSVAVVLAACQPGQRLSTAENTPPPTPSQQATVVPETQQSAIEPLHTDLPPSPRCFPFEEVSPITFTPDSTSLVIKDRSGVRVLNLETLEDNVLKASQELVSAALSPDGELLAWSLMDNTLQLIRMDDQTLVKTMEGHTLPTFKLRFSPTGDRLFSASYDTWVRVWDRNGEPLDAFQPTAANDLPNDIQGIGISPDGTLLGSIPFDGPARVWNLATKREIADLGGTGGDVISDIAFSPDGQFVAADQAGHLSLWRTSDWNVVWTDITSIAFAFSPGGRYLAYSDMSDNNVSLHSLDESQPPRILQGNQFPIYELFYSPDGNWLAAAGAGIQIWQAETGQLSFLGKAECP
jgi:WD40 repeat protein